MKKFLSWAAPALMASMLFVGCQKSLDTVSEDGLRDGTRVLANQAYSSCESQCIDLDAETVVYYEKTYTGNYVDDNDTPLDPNDDIIVGTVTLKVYNTEDKVWYKFSSTVGMKLIRIGSETLLNTAQNVNDAASNPTTFEKSYNINEFGVDWMACDDYNREVEVRRNQSGAMNAEKQIIWNTTYDLIGICDDCEYTGNSFGGVANSCATGLPPNDREAVYTFSSEDGVAYFKMQGGLNNFTGTNATVFINGVEVVFDDISDDGWDQGIEGGFIVGQRIPGQSFNRNIRIEGSLAECSQIVVRIVWNSDNEGAVITGEWSVVDALDVELAPEVLGLSCN